MLLEQLVVQNLAGGYGRIPILFGIDLRVRQGEFVAVLGHNGMGKTTLMRTLAGHLPPTQGQIHFEQKNMTHAQPHFRAQAGIGYVPQGRLIFPALTVHENLRMGAIRAGRRESEKSIESVLEDFPRLKPLLDRAGGVLSGGEQQMLAIARCLAGRPRLLLLDEPTEGIQPSIIEELQDLLRRFSARKEITVILVEQNLEFIRSTAERVFVIRKGRLSAEVNRASIDDPEMIDEFVGFRVRSETAGAPRSGG